MITNDFIISLSLSHIYSSLIFRSQYKEANSIHCIFTHGTFTQFSQFYTSQNIFFTLTIHHSLRNTQRTMATLYLFWLHVHTLHSNLLCFSIQSCSFQYSSLSQLPSNFFSNHTRNLFVN